MAKRERQNELKIYLNDDEQYILRAEIENLRYEKQVIIYPKPDFVRICL